MQVSWITLQSGYIVLGHHLTFSHHIIVDINCNNERLNNERFPIWYPDVEHFRLFFCCYFFTGGHGKTALRATWLPASPYLCMYLYLLLFVLW